MALSERFETKGSKPEAKAPPKRRHFAVDNWSTWNTSAQRAERAVKSRGVLRGAAIGAPQGQFAWQRKVLTVAHTDQGRRKRASLGTLRFLLLW